MPYPLSTLYPLVCSSSSSSFQSLEAAAQAIVTSLPYQRLSTPFPEWDDFSLIDPTTPNSFPKSIALMLRTPEDRRSGDDPAEVLVHPQSYFSYDVYNHDLSLQLHGFPSNIRFPTRIAFLDTLITTVLEPPLGFRHLKLHLRLMTYLAYLLTYTLRHQPRVQPSGELEAEHASVVTNLKEENRPFFENLLRKTSKG